MKKQHVEKRRWLRYFIHLMVVTLIVSSIPLETVAETIATNKQNGESTSSQSNFEEKQSQPQLPADNKPSEVVQERKENEKVFDNKDGTFTKRIYDSPVHMKEEGKWEEISPKLVEHNHKFTTKKTKINVTFEQVMKNGEYIQFEENGHKVKYKLQEANGESGSVKAQDVKPEVKENTIWHKQIFPDVDLRSIVFHTSVKEDIVLQKYTGHNVFHYEIQTDLDAKQQDDGSIVFQDQKQTTLFTLPKPTMSDSNVNPESGETNSSQDVTYTIEKKTNGVYQLTLTANADWLKSPERKYPVYIDPTTESTYQEELPGFENAYVSSAYPGTNYSGANKLWDPGQNAHTLKVGHYDGTTGDNYSYLKQNLSSLSHAQIQKAKFKAYAKWNFSTTPSEVWLSRVKWYWSPQTITWNNGPAVENITSTSVGREQWAEFDVTNTVQEWVNNPNSNYGFALHTNGNGKTHWKKFIATESGMEKAPVLEVTYSYPRPEKAPKVTAHSHNNASNTGYFNLEWDAVPGATGYKVGVFNGYEYEYYRVGNVTNWSTYNQKIWPTKQQVEEGYFDMQNRGTGEEIPLDPSPVYTNAYNAYKDQGASDWSKQKAYWFVIVAEHPMGDSPRSYYAESYVPLDKVKKPVVSTYTNLSETKSGHVSLKWDAVLGATGYKVWVYNGKTYDAIDVGNVTSWSTQGRGIWPTQAEIGQGRYQIHTDGKGAELALDPSPVYKNSGGNYGNHQGYWMTVSAYSSTPFPEGKMSEDAEFRFADATQPLGVEEFWSTIDVIGGKVTPFNGNFVMNETDFTLAGQGPDVVVDRTYNSQDTGKGLFGKSWFSSLEVSIKEASNGDIIYTTGDKNTYHFRKIGENQYEAPTGIYLTVAKKSDGNYSVTDKNKNIIEFHKDGYLLSEKDSYKNTVQYKYENNKLVEVVDPSNRTIRFSYNQDGYIEGAVGPENRKVTFTYSDGYLTMSTTPEGRKYQYGYENGKLTSIKDPKHTDAKPYQTIFGYENNKLVKITDPVGKVTSLFYKPEAREVIETNPKGKKTSYTYNEAGNPVKQIVDIDNLKLTTEYTYRGNNLEKTITPKKQEEAIQYDGNGNVLSVTDAMGTETAEYNKNNDVIKVTDNENRATTVAYKETNAAISETDTAALTASVTHYDKYGNPIETSKSIGTGANLLQNPNFESNLDKWTLFTYNDQAKMDAGTFGAPGGLGGVSSLKLTSKSTSAEWGYVAAIQEVTLEPNKTYTLSGMMKTDALQKADAFYNVQLFNENGQPVAGGNDWHGNRYSNLQGTKDWTNRQLTFKTTNDTRKAKIYLEVEHTNASAGGTVWFDKLQLEEGEVSSSFNPVVNSSFEDNWSGGFVPNWQKVCAENCQQKEIVAEGFNGADSILLERKDFQAKDIAYAQKFAVNQKTAKTITLTAMSKSENVENESGEKFSKDYSVWADVIYADGSWKNYQAMFPTGTNDWNRSAVLLEAKDQPIQEVHIYLLHRGKNKGKAWFDDVRLIEGNVLTKNTYDAHGNVKTIADEEGNTTSYQYDGVGNKKAETDEKGNTKSFDYNLDNQLKKVTLKNGTSVDYKYDTNGNTTEKLVTADGKSQVHTFEYDQDNKLKKFKDALQREINHEYDENGNKLKTTMPNGHILGWTYDTADRLVGVTRNGKEAFSFELDAHGQETKVKDHVNGMERGKEYDDADRIKKMTDSRGGHVDWTYHDKANSKSEKLKEIKLQHGSHQSTISYEYNQQDQNTKVTEGTHAFRFDYDDHGNVRTYTAGNGSGSTFNYDQTGKVSDLVVGTKPYGEKSGETILLERYKYDKTGNRTEIARDLESNKKEIVKYEYDSINQLKKETIYEEGKESTPKLVKEYDYDGFGNRKTVKETVAGKTVKNVSLAFNAGNQLETYGNEKLKYDADGNRTADGKYSYTWNEADQLTTITKQGETTPFAKYKYDDAGRRIEKEVNGQITRYFYDGDSINPLYETNGSGEVLRQYVYSIDGVRLAMKAQGQTVFYHYNPRGDVVAMTDTNGQVVANYEYDAWGNVLKSDTTGIAAENPFGYAGYMYDKEIGMYYLIARYYNPEHGVFLSVDPDPGDEDDPVTQNGYTYADNNPVMMTDPDGKWAWLVPVAIAGGMVAARYGAKYAIRYGAKYGKQAAKWVGNKAKTVYNNYKHSRAVNKELKNIGKQTNKVQHILAPKHNWNKVTKKPGDFKSVSKVMGKVMRKGKETPYKKSSYQRTMKVKGQQVTVTYAKKNGKIYISNGWVK
ncbi:DNRLRE domain-containing protein [Bacillus toyonensis]|uniref:DNRLRE domain-containing protein n=1 Tax=Bacillus toyonensis TaxID=155322 RepID=UPI000BEC6B24|nr:DNRLRE domain-containing protein [Bacillus toyonensis]PDZ30732.1 wall-associated protein [Bacillus toyonensis]PEI42120.1 wall-associated protein [Bacillus toyonensis]PEJ10941.1 wall-associated protein [Bacillus toyonensis]PGE72850.1 wall-associated protein [Bacillus toyonensis]HDR7512209.1 DNRLRE domain-containing protein [Bacillus toyonensis]